MWMKDTWTYALIPARSFLVGSSCACLIADFGFEEFGEILLVGSCTAKVSFAAVVLNCYIVTLAG